MSDGFNEGTESNVGVGDACYRAGNADEDCVSAPQRRQRGNSGALTSLIVLVALILGCRNDRGPRVDYVSVEAASQKGFVTGYQLVLRVELETRTSMPHVAPHVKVLARCDGQSDDGQLFWMSLSNAEPGERKVDETELFRVRSLSQPASRCEITLALEPGPDGPVYYCHAGGKTVPGRCP